MLHGGSAMYATYERLGVHVYASDVAVIRAAYKKLSALGRSREKRRWRRRFYDEMLGYHKEARQLCIKFRL